MININVISNNMYNKYIDKFFYVFVFIIGSLYLYLSRYQVSSLSIDFAHHYSLIHRLSLSGFFWTDPDNSLGEMSIYPRLSHIIASILGSFVHSDLLGMNIVAKLSIYVGWIFIALLLKVDDRRLSCLSLISIIIIYCANQKASFLVVFGDEVKENFLFSQLVAFSLSLLFVLIYSNLVNKFNYLISSFFLVFFIYIIAFVHLLPSIVLLGFLGVDFLYRSILNFRNKEYSLKRYIGYFCVFLLSALLVFLHPSFSSMSSLSGHDGGVYLAKITYPVGVILLSLLVLFLSVSYLIFAIKNNIENLRSFRFIAYLGISYSILCFIQYFLLKYFDVGSPYAVKKYIFAISTLFIVDVSILISIIIDVVFFKCFHKKISNVFFSFSTLVILFILFVIYSDLNRGTKLDVYNFLRIEKDIGKIKLELNNSSFPNSVFVRSSDSLSDSLTSYTYSISNLQASRDLVFGNRNDIWGLAGDERVDYIFGEKKYLIEFLSECDVSPDSSNIYVMSAECVNRKFLKATFCTDLFLDSFSNSLFSRYSEGFGDYEVSGRWSLGGVVSFQCNLYPRDDLGALKLAIDMSPFVHGPVSSQRFDIYVNKELALSGVASLAKHYIIDFQKLSLPSSDRVLVELHFPDAISPKNIDLSGDSRTLGFYFKKIKFIY